MVISRTLVLGLALCAGSAWADRCIPEGWRQLEGPISNQWCVGTFKYDGGGVAYYVNFRNDSSQSADVNCDVWYDGGQKSYVGGTVRGGADAARWRQFRHSPAHRTQPLQHQVAVAGRAAERPRDTA